MTKDIEKVTTADVVPFDMVTEALLQPGAQLADTPEDAARGIVEDILSATSAEEVLDEAEVIHARDMLDVPFVLISARFNNSTAGGNGIAIYAMLDAALDTGERALISCGARNVVAQVHRLMQLNSLPRRVRIVERGVAQQGQNRPMRLVAAPDDRTGN